MCRTPKLPYLVWSDGEGQDGKGGDCGFHLIYCLGREEGLLILLGLIGLVGLTGWGFMGGGLPSRGITTIEKRGSGRT